jgi:predicted DNA-binding transcriptional regulator YafY
MNFERTNDLVTDLQLCIDNGNPIIMQYVDRKGQASERKALPIETRGDRCFMADLDKMALRVFILAQISGYEILDEYINKDDLTLT